MFPYKFYLRVRRSLGVAPLPEEQLGLKGPDQEDPKDFIKVPQDGRAESINLLDLYMGDYGIEIRDQGRTNRCTGFTGAALIELMHGKLNVLSGFKNEPAPTYSANQIYWHARDYKKVDNGAFMRDLMRVLVNTGGTPHHIWPDHMSPLRYVGNEHSAPKFKIDAYERLVLGKSDTIENMKQVLSVEHLPVAIGVMMYDRVSREAVRDGYFRMPHQNDQQVGGHAMLVVGWFKQNGQDYFILINSWGTRSGKRGFFFLPAQAFLEGIVLDAWTVRKDTY